MRETPIQMTGNKISAVDMMIAMVKSGCRPAGALFEGLTEDEKARVLAAAK